MLDVIRNVHQEEQRKYGPLFFPEVEFALLIIILKIHIFTLRKAVFVCICVRLSTHSHVTFYIDTYFFKYRSDLH